MDVVCGRCRAEYEFDDALISERGTTVRCTNCGLQFKVFPPVGLRAPEVWLVFDPRDRRVEPTRYDSLREMQKDIARGAVTADHLLARGDQEPRPLREIVELQPLLQQPKSEPPPPSDSSPVHAAPAPPGPPAPPGQKTVLGVAQRPDPAAFSGAPSPPRPPQDSSSDVEEIVPAQHSDPHIPITPVKARDAKPRIRSALSMSPSTTKASRSSDRDGGDGPGMGTDFEEVDGRGSIPPPRQSLRSTLGSSTSQRPSPVPGAPVLGEGGPPSSKGGKPPSERGQRSTPVAEKPLVAMPVEPTISESGEYHGLMTPTPTGMRSYGSADADPVSSLAGVHVKQSARTGGIVLAVFVGGAAFLGFANRDKLSEALSDTRPERADPEAVAPAIPSEFAERLERADAAWISVALLKNPDSEFSAPSVEELKKLESELSALGVTHSWEKVNLLRAAGRLADARESAGSLDKSPEQSYALALLDLAEAKDDPPWPVVVERLREASSGERGRFLARTVYIYSLATSGALPRALADFEALSQISGAKEAPLYEDLRAYLARLGAFEGKAEDVSTTTSKASGDVTSDEARSADGTNVAAESGASPSAEKPAEVAETAEATVVKDAADRPATPKVSDAIKAKVAQADEMWRGGNQEGALVIYRQVVAQIGTKHFLGQRSASRIAQAEREKAVGP